MANLSVRGLEDEAAAKLKEAAAQHGLSVNAYTLKLLRSGLGMPSEADQMVHHELDALAGTWSEDEARTFEAHLEAFEQIDEDLWR